MNGPKLFAAYQQKLKKEAKIVLTWQLSILILFSPFGK